MPGLRGRACLDPGQDKRQQLSSQVTAGPELKGLQAALLLLGISYLLLTCLMRAELHKSDFNPSSIEALS